MARFGGVDGVGSEGTASFCRGDGENVLDAGFEGLGEGDIRRWFNLPASVEDDESFNCLPLGELDLDALAEEVSDISRFEMEPICGTLRTREWDGLDDS